MAELRKHLPHIRLTKRAVPDKYVSPHTGRSPAPPRRDRAVHARRLLDQISSLSVEQNEAPLSPQFDGEDIIRLEFESEPGFDLATKSLDLQSKGIYLLLVREVDDKKFAVVMMAREKLGVLIKKIRDYRDETLESGKPRNQALVDTISNIRRAHVGSLWTDTDEVFPRDGETIWWEVWVQDGADSSMSELELSARRHGATLGRTSIKVLDRTVVLVEASLGDMKVIVEEVGAIAELRRAKVLASDFRSLPSIEQGEWVRMALGLIRPPRADAPAVCVLDTGIHPGHQLLALAVSPGDLHAWQAAWGVHDHHGHGTEMAGLALYGDLSAVLLSTNPIQLSHCLESVKILPPIGDNPPELYGAITIDAISAVENSALQRERSVCMAVTATDNRDRGRPSSWSAVIDQLSFGTDESKPVLIAVSAGNAAPGVNYPQSNFTEEVHDPGQAWNALTVGAFTEKAIINEAAYAGYTPIAPLGDLSPTSATSITWKPDWPIKPEIVMEGGNWATNPSGDIANPDSLSLLTTHFAPVAAHFSCISDTSAAVAQASNVVGRIQALYPWAWPETVRGLMVHAARWTRAMERRLPGNSAAELQRRLRAYGFGATKFERALWSATNALTLIIQDDIQPFEPGAMKELNIHDLAWPREELAALGDEEVELRITLSYFIEPNPARRGWTNRHRYRSHGLRFATIKATETPAEFQKRINKARREEDEVFSGSGAEPGWLLGDKLRTKGSIHSDVWKGSAVQLAQRSKIAIYPVVGWWRDRPNLKRWLNRTRYSLVVSIESPRQDIDIYTPVENMVTIET